jgi:hypothetical protein
MRPVTFLCDTGLSVSDGWRTSPFHQLLFLIWLAISPPTEFLRESCSERYLSMIFEISVVNDGSSDKTSVLFPYSSPILA